MFTLLLVAHLHAQEPATAGAPAPTTPAAAAPADAAAAPTPAVAAPAPAPAPVAAAAPAPAAEEKEKAEISATAWLKELFHLAGKGDFSGVLVVGTMVGMLFWSMFVGFERLALYRRARSQSARLGGALDSALKTSDFPKALAAAKDPAYKDSYLGRVVEAALSGGEPVRLKRIGAVLGE
jgi:hypothetical protein